MTIRFNMIQHAVFGGDSPEYEKALTAELEKLESLEVGMTVSASPTAANYADLVNREKYSKDPKRFRVVTDGAGGKTITRIE